MQELKQDEAQGPVPPTIGDESYVQREIDRCWQRHDYHLAEQSKVICWMGSTFVGMLVLTGLFDDRIRTSDGMWPVWFLVLVHTTYLIACLFYLHNKLQAETFQHMARTWERSLPSSRSEITLVRHRYSASRLWGSRLFSILANTLTAALYFATVYFAAGGPTQVTERGLQVDFRTLITAGVFIVVVGLSWVGYYWAVRYTRLRIECDIGEGPKGA